MNDGATAWQGLPEQHDAFDDAAFDDAALEEAIARERRAEFSVLSRLNLGA